MVYPKMASIVKYWLTESGLLSLRNSDLLKLIKIDLNFKNWSFKTLKSPVKSIVAKCPFNIISVGSK